MGRDLILPRMSYPFNASVKDRHRMAAR
jgi:hypothetical protein